MPRKSSSTEVVNFAAKLADLKEDHYRVLLTVSALVELLVEKGLITREELERKASSLELELDNLISASLHPMA